VNDCLPQAQTASQRTKAPVAESFAAALANAPDLSDLSYAATRVLIASAELFHEFGAAGTSVRDIAKSCGLSPGAFYKHFASKDDVLFRLVEHGHDSLEARIEAVLADCRPTPVGRLEGFVHGYVSAHLVHPEMARLVRREYVHLTPTRLEHVVTRRRTMRDNLARTIRAGARSKDFELIDGPNAATRTAVMILDMCSRTSEWYDPRRAHSRERPGPLAERYVAAALRLVGR
jgi:AcrR family transcriptional regulator